MNDIEAIASIEARLAKITQPKWGWDSYNTIFSGTATDDKIKIIVAIPDHPYDGEFTKEQVQERSDWYGESSRNAEFIAKAPVDIRYLLDLVKSQKAEYLANFHRINAAELAEHERVKGIEAENAELKERISTTNKDLAELTPGGSEFHEYPKSCISFISDRMQFRASVIAENVHLKERVRDLEADKARLDWLSESGTERGFPSPTFGHKWEIRNIFGNLLSKLDHDSLRDALDAAMEGTDVR